MNDPLYPWLRKGSQILGLGVKNAANDFRLDITKLIVFVEFTLASLTGGLAAGRIAWLIKYHAIQPNTIILPLLVLGFWLVYGAYNAYRYRKMVITPSSIAISAVYYRNRLLFVALMVIAGYIGSR